ncbi:MAG: DUF4136 domain-containing protein [Cyclobacteriaceae bacterium]|nr:DUF4136 domain-containing protein [Cyclobacteriaceae bacterium]MDH4296137.1 DUF4136 domain-containing protein [Cyclobacteriaceae bacterium]MDH5248338.1 DUF4136 domain-containing protein [Cyclobacteriaceae bacterium]
MKPFSILTAVCIATLLLSCAESVQTYSDRDDKVDLQQYKTYAWIAPGDTVLNPERKDKLYGGYIVHVSNEELQKKGMTLDTEAPDAVFMFESHIEEKVKYSQSPSFNVGVGYGGPGYYVGGSVPVAGGELRATSYGEGLLVINMYDRRTGKLLWMGGAKKSISDSEDLEKVIKTAVTYIFFRLPIKIKT